MDIYIGLPELFLMLYMLVGLFLLMFWAGTFDPVVQG